MLKRALIIPDTHIPYHDKRAYKLMIKAAKDIKPDEIVILGDYADFYCVSSHTKDPSVFGLLIDEVDAVNKHLDELDDLFPKAKKVFIQGNHEFRFERYLQDKAPALFGITSVEHLLKINLRPNWKFIHYGPRQKYKVLGSYLTARHEPIGRTADLTARRAMCSLVYGHIHKIQSSYAVGMDGTQHVAFSVGWLGDKTLDKIYGYVKAHHDWQLGFGIVSVDENSGYFYHDIVPILDDYSCVVDGKIFRV